MEIFKFWRRKERLLTGHPSAHLVRSGILLSGLVMMNQQAVAQTNPDLSERFQPQTYVDDHELLPLTTDLISVRDVNNDGLVDLVEVHTLFNPDDRSDEGTELIKVSYGDGSKLPFSTDPSPSFWSPSGDVQAFPPENATKLLQDVNGDDLPDLVYIANAELKVRYNTGTDPRYAQITVISSLPAGTFKRDTKLVDIDNDGDLDFVYRGTEAGVYGLYYVRNEGNRQSFGPFADQGVLITQLQFRPVAPFVVGDVDVDGDLDIITGGVGSYAWLLNSGGAAPFAGVVPVNFNVGGEGGESLQLVDLNADSYPDLISVGGTEIRSRYFINLGADDLFQGSTGRTVGPDQLPIVDTVFADMDGDGDQDMLYISRPERGAGTTYLKLNSGGAVPFTSADNGSLVATDATGERFVTAEDLDADDDVDVMATGLDNYLYLNNGFSGFPMPVISASGDARVDEQDAYFELTIELDRPVNQPVTVEFSTVGGSATPGEDFFGVFEKVQFAPGEQQKIVRVRLIADDDQEQDEDFSWYLAFADGANLSQRSGTVTIGGLLDLSLTTVNPVALESSGTLFFVFGLSEPAQSTVRFSVATNSAASEAKQGIDFYGDYRILEIAPGDSKAVFPVTLLKDDVVEGQETLVLNVFNIENARLTDERVFGYIRDDRDVTYMQVNDLSISEGGVAQPYIVIWPVASVPVSVGYATRAGSARPGADYYGTSGRITIPAGERIARFPVQTIDNTAIDGERKFTVRLFRPENSTILRSEADVTIRDND